MISRMSCCTCSSLAVLPRNITSIKHKCRRSEHQSKWHAIFCVVLLKALQGLTRKTYLLFTFFRVLGLGSFFFFFPSPIVFRTRKTKDLTSPYESKNSHVAIPLAFQQMVTDGNAASETPCIHRIFSVIHLPTWPSWQTSQKRTKSQVTHTSISCQNSLLLLWTKTGRKASSTILLKRAQWETSWY